MPLGESELELRRCALTDKYALVVQVFLAFLAFLSLVLKRFLEPPAERRPWLVWFFDTSKQVAGAGVIHVMNVFLADLFQGDPCTWYVLSFLLDSSIGLLLMYICVKTISCFAKLKDWSTLRFGEYGTPPSFRPWFHQCLAFIGITVVEKIFITVIVQFKFWRDVRKVILSPIRSPKVEVTIVMLVIPFVVNTFMFWIVDNFTKRKTNGIKNRIAGSSLKKNPEKDLSGASFQSEARIEVNELEKLLVDDDLEEVELNSPGGVSQPAPSNIPDNYSLFLRHNSTSS